MKKRRKFKGSEKGEKKGKQKTASPPRADARRTISPHAQDKKKRFRELHQLPSRDKQRDDKGTPLKAMLTPTSAFKRRGAPRSRLLRREA